MVAQPPAKRRTGLNPLAYEGVEPLSPANFILQLRDPRITDNQGYNIGDIWLNAVTEEPWILVNLYRRVATWLPFGTGGVSGILSLTGNTGGPVFGDLSENVNTIANPASNLTVTGNPGTNTTTIETASGTSVGLAITGDVGAAAIFDGAGNIDALGGANINTETPGGGSELTTNLTDVIRWPNTNIGGTTGVIYLNGTSGAGGNRFMHNAGSSTNAFLGLQSGNFSATGTENTGIGREALSSLTSGAANTAVGSLALENCSVTDGNSAFGAGAGEALNGGSGFNTFVGILSGNSATTASRNSALGRDSLLNLVSGVRNLALGDSAGSGFTTNDSDNIIIGAAGSAGTNGEIRIGENGIHTTNFQEGIVGVTVANPANVVIDTVTHQLGVGTTPGVAGDNLFIATQPTFSNFLPVPVTYRMGDQSILTELTDVDGVFFPGNGAGTPASFTAPAAGNFTFTWNLVLTTNNVNDWLVQNVYMGFVINGARSTNSWFRRVNTFKVPPQNPSSTSLGLAAPGYNVYVWTQLDGILTAILPLSMGDVVTFQLSLSGTQDLLGSTIGFTNLSAATTPVGQQFGGTSNFISGYRVS